MREGSWVTSETEEAAVSSSLMWNHKCVTHLITKLSPLVNTTNILRFAVFKQWSNHELSSRSQDKSLRNTIAWPKKRDCQFPLFWRGLSFFPSPLVCFPLSLGWCMWYSSLPCHLLLVHGCPLNCTYHPGENPLFWPSVPLTGFLCWKFCESSLSPLWIPSGLPVWIPFSTGQKLILPVTCLISVQLPVDSYRNHKKHHHNWH